jgi:hypothetical protein
MESYSFNDSEIKAALRRTTPPYCANTYPANGATEVARDTNVTCHLLDAGSGVSSGSITMQVLVGGSAVAGQLDISNNFLDYTLIFNPTNNLPSNTLVTVRVNGKDLFNNTMTQYQWTFTTYNDTNLTPESFGKIKTLYH